jgi:hypothetical protein
VGEGWFPSLFPLRKYSPQEPDMRSKSEFLARMSEYGWLKYGQSVARIVSGPATLEDQVWNNPSSVDVWKFLKGHSDITVVYDTSSDIDVDFIVTLIGGCHEHRKEVSQIAMGTDLDGVEEDSEAALFN